MAYYLPNPGKDGKRTSFDVCVKTNDPNGIPGTEMGDMIEAKNKVYDWLFPTPMYAKDDTEKTTNVNESWNGFLKQFNNQYDSISGTGRHLFYCFEGKGAADFAEERLGRNYPDVTFMQCK